MPVKAPPPVPAPVYSWTGWYVGGNVGYSWGKSNNTWPMTAAYTEKLPWFGTLRGRIGVVSDRVLFYATGGLAYGAVKMNGSATISGTNTPGPPPTCSATSICPLANWSNDATSVGFTVGCGVEGVLAYNWTWKIEYLHIDLGNVTTTFATSPVCFGGPVLGGLFVLLPERELEPSTAG